MKKLFLSAIISLLTAGVFAQANIAEARNMSLGSTVTVTGIVTNGSELGPIRYIQDETAGIAVYPGTGSVEFNPNRGDEITVTGTLKDYNQLLELDPVTSYTVNSSGNDLPGPLTLTPGQIAESYEAQLLKIENATFAVSGNFSGSTNYDLTANGESFEIRINSNSNLVGEIIPTGEVNIVAICSQYSFSDPNTGYQLLPRDQDDITLLSPLYFTSVPAQSGLSNQGFTISWETNEPSSTHIDYGLTQNLELGTVTGDDNVTSHSITFSDLDAGEIYFIKAYSVSGNDTTPSEPVPFATVSNSSGAMHVYFNQSVDNTVSSGVDAIAIPGAVADTIIAYINKAQQTLDLCVYNNNMSTIVAAVNEAYNRGVTVRYITEDETANIALSNLNGNIPLLPGNNNGLMHNKFVVIDADSETNAWILTGSTNFTDNNLDDDFNNLICIQDQSLAKAFRMEFNEMWGSSGENFNVTNARFGEEKLDNTPHKFIINSLPVELYFSPSDNVTGIIENAIGTAENDVEFALLTFTKNELGTAMVNAHNAGVNVKGIIENENDTGGEYEYLLENGVNVIPHSASGVLHHKYAMVDANLPSSDPVVITGSHNWSASAEDRNDENTLVIYDATMANIYYQEFNMRWQELSPTNPPVLVDDELIVVQNIPKTFNVLENDNYLTHLELNITVLSGPDNGTLVLNGDNSFTYTPATDYLGEDAFTYKMCYIEYPDLCDEADVSITIDVEQAPEAIEDTVSIPVNMIGSPSSVSFNVLANDLNPNNVELIAQIVQEAAHGNDIMIDSIITYVPDLDFEGKDTVIYEICSANNNTLCSQGLFIITVGEDTRVVLVDQQFECLVFPNPNRGSFDVKTNFPITGNIEISVYNAGGVQIYQRTDELSGGKTSLPFRIRNVDPGLYFLTLQTDYGLYTTKFIID